jgi:hypothetical protein
MVTVWPAVKTSDCTPPTTILKRVVRTPAESVTLTVADPTPTGVNKSCVEDAAGTVTTAGSLEANK